MRTNGLCLFVACFTLVTGGADAQWAGPGGSGNMYMTGPTDGVTIGTTTAAPPGALTIRGNEMTSPTGVVFTTYTGNSVVHSWRMNKGSGQEWIGHIFNPSSSSDKTFNIDARSDNLRFLTNEVHRAALWYRVGNQTINSSLNPRRVFVYLHTRKPPHGSVVHLTTTLRRKGGGVLTCRQ